MENKKANDLDYITSLPVILASNKIPGNKYIELVIFMLIVIHTTVMRKYTSRKCKPMCVLNSGNDLSNFQFM